MIGGVFALADEKKIDKKSVIKFNCRKRMNHFGLTNAAQSLLILKKRKIGDGDKASSRNCVLHIILE